MDTSEAIARVQARARAVRARAAVRAWKYRQRDNAYGVWFRFRLLLAATKSAWTLPEEEARRLVAEGYEPAEVGSHLEPPKILVLVPEERVRTVRGRAPIGLRLGPEFLAARCLALVPFRFPEEAPKPDATAPDGAP